MAVVEGKKKDDERPTDLWMVALIASGIVALLGILEFILCGMAHKVDGEYMKYIAGYDEGNLLSCIGLVGLVGAMVGIYGIALCVYSKDKYNPCVYSKRPARAIRLRYMIYAYFGWGAGTVLMLAASAWLICFATGQLNVIFKQGFTKEIRRYHDVEAVRVRIDYVQQRLQCCGSVRYTEWFPPLVFSDKVGRTQMGFPESCCRQKPCTSVVNRGEARKLTPYTDGCIQSVVKRYEWILLSRGLVLVTMAIVEIAALVVIYLEVKRVHARMDTRMETEKLKQEDKEKGEEKEVQRKVSTILPKKMKEKRIRAEKERKKEKKKKEKKEKNEKKEAEEKKKKKQAEEKI